MPLFLMGCFPVDFQEVKRPLRTTSVKRPIKVGKRPMKEGKRPIKAMVLVGISVGCLMGCFRTPPPWRKTAPLKRPNGIKRSMRSSQGREIRVPGPVRRILLAFFQENHMDQGRRKILKKCPPAGTGTKTYFPSIPSFHVSGSENSRRPRLFVGYVRWVSEENSGKVPEKLLEIFPESRNGFSFCSSQTRSF